MTRVRRQRSRRSSRSSTPAASRRSRTSRLMVDVRTALTTGEYPAGSCATGQIGVRHTNMIGYVTIDVTNNCSQTLPTTSAYYTSELLFDNVLTGDYEYITPGLTGSNA